MKPYPFTGLLGLVIVSLFMFGHELHNYAPNFEKVDGAYCFWSVRARVTLFVPTVTFKLLKLESWNFICGFLIKNS